MLLPAVVIMVVVGSFIVVVRSVEPLITLTQTSTLAHMLEQSLRTVGF